MTELAALNIKITGDSTDLKAAIAAANGDLNALVAAAKKAGLQVDQTTKAIPRMGQALGGMSGKIGGISMQLQDMAVQASMGTSAMVILGQQGSQVASMFGPLGAAFGAVLAVAPLLAVAFMDNAENATALGTAMEDLTAATEAFRISAQAIRLGVDKEEVAIIERMRDIIAEISELEKKRDESTGPARTNLQNRISLLQAERNASQQILDDYRQRRAEEQAAINAVSVAERRRANERRNDYREEKASQDALKSSMVTAYSLYARTRMEAVGLANETARAASAFGALQQSLADRGKVYSGRGGDPRTANQQGYGQFQYAGPQLDQFNNPIAGGGGGGAAANQLQTELQTLQESLMTQEQLQMESYTRQQETLQQALDARLLSQKDYANLMQQVEATHQAKMGSQMREGVATTIGALSQLFNKSKPLAIASALVNTWQGMTEALKLPFPKNIAAAATTLATGMNAVRNIKSTSPGGGGSTSGSIGAGAAGAGGGAAPQQNVQTLNFTLTNDSFGIGQNLVRQIAAQLNEAQRNGSTLVRATVS